MARKKRSILGTGWKGGSFWAAVSGYVKKKTKKRKTKKRK